MMDDTSHYVDLMLKNALQKEIGGKHDQADPEASARVRLVRKLVLSTGDEWRDKKQSKRLKCAQMPSHQENHHTTSHRLWLHSVVHLHTCP
jgi:hypothetical protein